MAYVCHDHRCRVQAHDSISERWLPSLVGQLSVGAKGDMCVGMCADKYMDMHMGMCMGMCMNRCLGMCMNMCMGMCMNMCMGMYVYRHVHGHVYVHVPHARVFLKVTGIPIRCSSACEGLAASQSGAADCCQLSLTPSLCCAGLGAQSPARTSTRFGVLCRTGSSVFAVMASCSTADAA